jgi:hypothetical protein
MFTAVIGDQYRTVAITLIRQGISIKLTISEEMKCGMGGGTAEADARINFHLKSARRRT